jgi:hypothetical protein
MTSRRALLKSIPLSIVGIFLASNVKADLPALECHSYSPPGLDNIRRDAERAALDLCTLISTKYGYALANPKHPHTNHNMWFEDSYYYNANNSVARDEAVNALFYKIKQYPPTYFVDPCLLYQLRPYTWATSGPVRVDVTQKPKQSLITISCMWRTYEI